MEAADKKKLSLLLVLAVWCEALVVVFTFAPTGSLAALEGPPAGLLQAAFLLGLTLAATALLRLVLPGPKPPALFAGRGAASLGRSLYYGFAAAVLLTLFRAAWVVGLSLGETPLIATLPLDIFRAGPFAVLARVVATLAGAYLVYGYLQRFLGGALGRRAGLLTAATVGAAATIWPLAGAPYWAGSHAPALVFAAWRLPEALALAYLGERTRNVLAPLVAVFLMEWFAAVGTGLFAMFGRWPFLFACLIVFLGAAELAIAERRRVVRAVGGFLALIFGRAPAPEAGLLDGVLLAASFAGAYTLYRAFDLLAHYRVIAVAVGGALLAAAVVLAVVHYTRRPRAKAVAAGELPRADGN
ncbi:MAG: hypothetical protein JSU81_00830 [Candidatus Coatesbacteria bacterium]|nr:MAG: hypothetical protein JSU81_00830 [Candidatus Coatesbacteria bacterium]